MAGASTSSPPQASSSGTSRPQPASSSERTPLLNKTRKAPLSVVIDSPSTSFWDGEHEGRDALEGEGDDDGREVEVYVPGKSTSLQTLLNCLGDIIGTGLLAVPIAIAHLGWILGPTVLFLTGLLTLWTLKLILRIIEKDRRMRSFTDLIGYALGPWGKRIVTVLFFGEFGLWMVALVVLFSDTLAVVWPIYTSDEWKLVGMVITIPTSFVPLRYLSFTSGIGILSTWTLVAILIFSGIATPSFPGSLRDPAPTDLWPAHGLNKGLIAFSLILACFGGHGLIPNLIRDMRKPQQADRVVELTYGISMVVYVVIGVCGYLMYGRDVSDEISKDLAGTPGFSPLLNTIAVWMVALNPLTKVPLGLRPFSDILFGYLHLHPTVLIPENMKTPHHTRPPTPLSTSSSTSSIPEAHDPHLSSAAELAHARRETVKAYLRPIIRVLLAVLATVGALVMPSFESVMAILGGGFGVVMVLVLPVWAAGNVIGWKWWYRPFLGVSGVAAAVGVVAAVIAAREV